MHIVVFMIGKRNAAKFMMLDRKFVEALNVIEILIS